MAKTNDPKKVIFVVDAEPESSDFFSSLGEEYDVVPGDETSQGFLMTATNDDIYTDAYGTWISGAAPIYDSAGRAVASVGIDISASTVKSEVLRSFIFPFIILLLIEISLLVFLAKQVRVTQIDPRTV
jgi:adenylate cyclase